jgi:DNA uptake protein ComE-like DNA-binding protein
MKKFIPPEVKKWFGYDRKERRASVILIIVIFLVLAIRWLIPESNMDIIEIEPELLEASDLSGRSTDPSFNFDPNKASFDTLIKAGLEEREAKTLISYRSKGGRFRKPSDIGKVYGIDSVKAQRLSQRIVITSNKQNFNSSQRSLIDLNSCDSASLESLPGIGPVLSARIIKYRNLIGGYARIDQLREVYGLPQETFELIKPRFFADTSLLRHININTAEYSDLDLLPYLGRIDITSIIKYRDIQKHIGSISELVKNNIIPDSTARKIRPYLVF